MSAKNPNKEKFDSRINGAIAERKLGRKEIVDRLAGLTLEELARVPPSTLALLGPGGLAALAAARGDLSEGLVSASNRAALTPDKGVARTATPSGKKSYVWVVIGTLCLLASGPLYDLVQPFAKRTMDVGWRSVDASDWPACRRLDAVVDGCVYRVGGNSTTLAEIARHLHMPKDMLASLNQQVAAAPGAPLPRGTKVIVWRGNLELRGQRP